MRASTRLLPGSPHSTRLLWRDIGVGDLGSRRAPAASPRNCRRHSVMACSCSAATHFAIAGAAGVPVGRTKMKLSRKASSIGPCSPWRLCRPGSTAFSTGVQRAPVLRKCAVQERSDSGTGAFTSCAVDRHQRLARVVERAAARIPSPA